MPPAKKFKDLTCSENLKSSTFVPHVGHIGMLRCQFLNKCYFYDVFQRYKVNIM
jgi:hypothetical protein